MKPSIPQNAIPIEIGKLPPQALEIEEAILGCLMIDSQAIYITTQYLSSESFYRDSHQKIYLAIISLFNSHKNIDLLTVQEELKKQKILDEVGGVYYISQLTQKVCGAWNIEEYSMIVAQKFMAREMIRITSEVQTRAFDDSLDPSDIIDYCSSEVLKLSQSFQQSNIIRAYDAINSRLKVIEKISTGEIKLSGVPSGHTKIDRYTCGWQKTDLIIVAARPSMGKTAFALDIAKNASVFDVPTLFFSLEMNLTQLSDRMISSETDLTNTELRTGKIADWQWNRIEKCVTFFSNKNLYFDDSPTVSISQFRSKSYLFKNKYGIKLIVVDYLQLMKGFGNEKGNREQEISNISRNLKIVAKELDLPVIALAQLNRAVESRSGNKRPQLSDLRESGAIEQDADLVIFLNKPERYGILEDEEGNSMVNITEIIISKHRNGSCGEVRLKHNDGMSKFFDESEEIKPIENFPNPDSKIESNSNFDREPF